MLLILCQPVCTPSKQWLQQLYTNESKFNCENRIFLSYTWGQPETASGKRMRTTPQRSGPCQKVGAPWLFPGGFTHNPFIPPHGILCTPMEANQRGQRSILSEAGMPREGRQDLETGESYSFGSQRNKYSPLPASLSCFYFHSLAVSVHW